MTNVKTLSRFGMAFLMCMSPLLVNAQQSSGSFLEGHQKYFVVAAVFFIIFTVLIIFLLFLERKISRLERRLDSKN